MRRARAIEPDAAVLLEAAAVLGPGAEVRHAAGLTGLPRQRVATLMDGLAAIGVLAGDERLRFVHPLVEASVHAALPAGERAEAHLWVARALADDDAPAEVVRGAPAALRQGRRRVGHADAPDGRGAGAGHRRRRPGGGAARARAPGAAARATQRAHVLLELGRAQAIAGAPEALGRLAEAIERLPAAEERAATALETGRTLLSLGRLEEAARGLRPRRTVSRGRRGRAAAALLRAASATAARTPARPVGRTGGRPRDGARPRRHAHGPRPARPAGARRGAAGRSARAGARAGDAGTRTRERCSTTRGPRGSSTTWPPRP